MERTTTEVVGKLLTDFARLRFIRTQEVLNEFRLYPGQPYVLFTLMERGSMTQTQLAESVGRRPATITVMLSRMEEAGLITRDVSQKDRRCAFVKLTEKGSAVGKNLRDRYLGIDEECFTGLTTEEMNKLSGFVAKMNENLVRNLSSRDVTPMLALASGARPDGHDVLTDEGSGNKEKKVAAETEKA